MQSLVLCPISLQREHVGHLECSVLPQRGHVFLGFLSLGFFIESGVLVTLVTGQFFVKWFFLWHVSHGVLAFLVFGGAESRGGFRFIVTVVYEMEGGDESAGKDVGVPFIQFAP